MKITSTPLVINLEGEFIISFLKVSKLKKYLKKNNIKPENPEILETLKDIV